MENIDQATLQQLLALYKANPSLLDRIGEGDAGPTYSQAQGSTVNGYTISIDPNTGQPVISKPIKETSFGTDVTAMYDPTGKYTGISSGDSTNLGMAKFIAGALGMYGAGTGLDSMLSGTGAGASSGLSGMDLAADNPSLWDQVGNISASGGGIPGGLSSADKAAMYGDTGYGSGMTGAQTGAYDTALKAGTGSGLLSSGGSMLGDAAKAIGSNGQLIGAGLGAVAGALDGGDKTQASNRDPWLPAQDFLKQQIGQGQALSTKYQNQPFSPAQQTAYGNVGGLLDVINSNAGGLLGLANANASGQNQFVRGQPRQLIGGSQMNLSGFTPGLLGYLGSK